MVITLVLQFFTNDDLQICYLLTMHVYYMWMGNIMAEKT